MKIIKQKDNASGFKAAILIASSRSFSGKRKDLTGPELAERLTELNYSVISTKIMPDDQLSIISALKELIQSEKANLIFISGGTGLSPDDVTPEATLQVIERRIPGMEEAMRRESLKITPHGMLSRAVVGTAGKSLIINLPGNPKGALENLHVIEPALDHALKLLNGEKPDP
jgi:molybdopterin adenylyltransferase